jgi:hypothetical protein
MIVIRVKMTEQRPIGVVRDAWRAITRRAYREVGLYWVDTYLAGHFKPGATEKYRYKIRSKAYRERKERLARLGRPFARGGRPVIAGAQQPNVLTGHMREQLMQNIIVRGFPTRATVVMLGPQYLNTRYYKKAQPDKPKEITTVTREEAKDLARVLEKEIVKGINSYRRQKVTE